MTLDVDALMDRRRLKRQVVIWRVLAIVLAVAAIVAIVGRIALESSDYVARITISGVIAENRARDTLLQKVAEDSHVKAVIIDIDSPGGTVVGAEQIYARLRAIAAKKPVVATMGTLATSAGYYVAAGTDRIFAHDGSITASIGVIFQATDLTALLDKIGVKIDLIKSGAVKASPNPFEKTSPEARAVIDALVKDTFDQFLSLVRDRRHLTTAEVQTISDGRVLTGRQAKALHLVDELGGADTALSWLQRAKGIAKDLKIRDLEPERTRGWAALLGQTLGLRQDLAGGLALDGLISLWHPAFR
jgi:protease-4